MSHLPGAGRSKLLAVAILTALSLALNACSSPESSGLDGLREKGTVRVAVADGLPTSGSDKTPTGLVPELVADVFKNLGVDKVEIVPMDWDAQIPALNSGRVDVIAGGFYKTPDRCKALVLAAASYYFLDGMAVPKGNPRGVKEYKDIAEQGLRLGVVSGGAEDEAAEAAGVKTSQISQYPDLTTLLDALKADRVDVVSYDNVDIAYQLAKPAYSDLTATPPTVPIVDGKPEPYSVSVGFPKGEPELVKAFNEEQEKMFAAGDFDALMAKWKQKKEDLRPADAVNNDTVCGE